MLQCTVFSLQGVLLKGFYLLLMGSTFIAVGQVSSERIPVYNRYEELEWMLTQDNDTTYVFNFWATWCKPCVKELPYFQRLHELNHDQKYKVMLISLDMARDVPDRLEIFLSKHQITANVIALTDTRSHLWIPKVDGVWSGAIPATFVRKGNKTAFFEGEFEDYHTLELWINQIKD